MEGSQDISQAGNLYDTCPNCIYNNTIRFEIKWRPLNHMLSGFHFSPVFPLSSMFLLFTSLPCQINLSSHAIFFFYNQSLFLNICFSPSISRVCSVVSGKNRVMILSTFKSQMSLSLLKVENNFFRLTGRIN